MNIKNSLIVAATIALALASSADAKKTTQKAYLGTPNGTVLTIKETITDDNIVPPQSFETDTKKMMENWYLQNYVTLDADVEHRPNGTVSDEEYIRRLKAMPTAIEMPYNSIVRQYIDLYVERRRTMVEQLLGLGMYYFPIFEQALEQEGLPNELKYLPVIESALNPDAVSRVGATGLWQFMPPTARGLGLEINSLVDERRDPIQSSLKAAKYLKNLYNTFGDWSLVIAAYNCGPGNVLKAIRRAGGETKDYWEIYPYLPKETRGYVPAFIAANYALTYFKRHNISPSLAKKPLITDTVHVNQRIHFSQISQVLNIPMNVLRVLNPQYRRDIIPGENRPYALILPSQQVYSFIMSKDSIANYRTDLYGQRGVVEPATYKSEQEITGDYTWETKTVTKYHTVKKNETISKVAHKYGVTTSSIKKANGLKSNALKAGQKLKITTTQRVKVAVEKQPEQQQDAEEGNNPEDELGDVGSTTDDYTEQVVAEQVNVAENNDDLPAALRKSEQVRTPSKPVEPKNEKPKPIEKQPRATSHTVAKGETLSSIATQYGVTIKDLQDENGINGSNIMVGQRLKIPVGGVTRHAKPATTTYEVKKGDNLGKIATAHGTTVEAIQDANGLRGNNIQVGQKLTIPTGASANVAAAEPQPTTVSYTVKKGDNLGKIATAHGTTVNAIQKANGLKGNNIQVGQKLTIPTKNSTVSKPTKKKKKK